MEGSKRAEKMLFDKLMECAEIRDMEQAHIEADNALIAFLREIGCHQCAAAFDSLPKWYV